MDEREIFEAWATTLDLDLTLVAGDHYSDCNTDFAWLAWQAARRTTPDRDAIIEECASYLDRKWDSAAELLRALKTTPTAASREQGND